MSMLHYNNLINKKPIFNNHTKENKKETNVYNDEILTFDIETTSYWIDWKNNKYGAYKPNMTDDFWNGCEACGLCYIWQFSFNDQVYFGRELNDFKEVLQWIDSSNMKSIIWVHNLSFEFEYLLNILTVDTVFARDTRKPMKFTAKEYPNIEFRCSYMLTRLSLESWGKQLGLPKLVGDLDYNVLRTPLTPMNDTELGYCERDCLVVYKGIKKYLEEYIYQEDIPITQTGCIRRKVKKLLCTKEYMKFIKKLLPRDSKEYEMLQEIFAGGYTHANRYYSGRSICGHIEHYDFTSSYPTVMCAEKYPMTPWKQDFRGIAINEENAKEYAFIIAVKYKNIKCLTQNTYIQKAKCWDCKNVDVDNGRVISADEISMLITEQDYFIIQDCYDYECEIMARWISKKEYLPKTFIDYILELYENKTTLKDVIGQEDLYQQSKQYINSLFGMCVTGFIQADVVFTNGAWKLNPLTEQAVDDKIQEIKSNSWNQEYFLSYSWGCWITAYARRNLWKCIKSVDSRMMYADTDSVFVLGHCDFSWYNIEITNKLKVMCDKLGIDFNRTKPKTIKGVEKPLGIFDKESDIKEFKTLGAKRYVERRLDNKLYLTVSGVPKEAVADLENNTDNFCLYFIFDKDSDKYDKHKKLHTYNDNQSEMIFSDGYHMKYTHGIALRNTSYAITMSDDYLHVLERFGFSVDCIPEKIMRKFRNRITQKKKAKTI